MASAAEAAPKLSATERIRQKRLQKQGQSDDNLTSSSPSVPEVTEQAAEPVSGADPTPEAEGQANQDDAGADEYAQYQGGYDNQGYDEQGYYDQDGAYEYADDSAGSPTAVAPDLEAAAAQDREFVEQMALSKQRLEEEVAAKKELISKTIQERFDQAMKETEILNMVRQELKKLDEVAQTDIDMLRIKIDETVKQLASARVRYERAETEFMNAKMDLQIKKNEKALLTEHFTLLIQQNEQRKAEKLESLMERLAITNEATLGELKQTSETKQVAPAENAPASASSAPAPPPPGSSPPVSAPVQTPPAADLAPSPTSAETPPPAPPVATSPSVPTSVSPPPAAPKEPVPTSPGPSPSPASPPPTMGKGKGKGPPPPGYRGPPPGKGGVPPGKGKGMPPGKGPLQRMPPGKGGPASPITQPRGPPSPVEG